MMGDGERVQRIGPLRRVGGGSSLYVGSGSVHRGPPDSALTFNLGRICWARAAADEPPAAAETQRPAPRAGTAAARYPIRASPISTTRPWLVVSESAACSSPVVQALVRR